MKSTKKWGFVNSGAQLYMLNHAEHTRIKLSKQKKRPTYSQSVPAFSLSKNK